MTSINTHTTCREQNGQWWPGRGVLLTKKFNANHSFISLPIGLSLLQDESILKRIILENKSSIHPRAKCTVVYLFFLSFTPPTAKANPSWSLRGKHQTLKGGGWVLNNTESLPLQGVKVTLLCKSFDLFKWSHLIFAMKNILLNLAEIFSKQVNNVFKSFKTVCSWGSWSLHANNQVNMK